MSADLKDVDFKTAPEAKSTLLYKEIQKRLSSEVDGYKTGDFLTAKSIHEQTELNRQTCTKVLARLAQEGYLRQMGNRGYVIESATVSPRTDTLLSITRLAVNEKLEIVSALDTDSFGTRTVSESGRQEQLKRHLRLDDNDRVLVFRRARGLRERGELEWHWVLLETAYLRVDDGLEDLGESIKKRRLPEIGDTHPEGNLSLHAMLSGLGLELTKSEYTLSLGSESSAHNPWTSSLSSLKEAQRYQGLGKNEAKAWKKLRSPYKPERLFISLRSTTFAQGNRPIEFSVTKLVPGYFHIQMTQFRLDLPPKVSP